MLEKFLCCFRQPEEDMPSSFGLATEDERGAEGMPLESRYKNMEKLQPDLRSRTDNRPESPSLVKSTSECLLTPHHSDQTANKKQCSERKKAFAQRAPRWSIPLRMWQGDSSVRKSVSENPRNDGRDDCPEARVNKSHRHSRQKLSRGAELKGSRSRG